MERRASMLIVLVRSAGFLKEGRVWMTGAFLFLLLVSLLSVAGPLAIRSLIDSGIGQRDARLVSAFALAYLLIEGFRQGADFSEGILLRRGVQLAVRAIRLELFRHLQRVSLASSLGMSPGERMSRLTGDAAVMGEGMAASLFGILRDVLVFLGVSLTLLVLYTPLGLLSAACGLLFGIPAILFRRKSGDLSRRSRAALGAANHVLEENLAGHREIQLFALEEPRARRFSRANDELVGTALSTLGMQTFFEGTASTLSALALALVLWWGSREVRANALSVGLLVAVLQYVPQLLGSLRGMAEKWVSLGAALAAGERVWAVLDTPPALRETLLSDGDKPSSSGLKVADLHFGYLDREKVLRGISLHIHPGERVALIGKTGVGKTTLARLLARLYDPWSGRIELGGCDLRRIPVRDLRKRLLFQTQEVFIIRGTVLENITLGAPGVTREQAIAACHKVGANSLVERLPEGYETPIGEGGCALSIGEGQLLSFARALARDPEVLILDEPTAHLDLGTEDRILRAMNEVMNGRTTILVAHRPSTLRFVDRVLRMEGGLISDEFQAGKGVASLLEKL